MKKEEPKKEEEPKAEGEAPKVEGESPKDEGETPEDQEKTVTTEGEAPKAEGEGDAEITVGAADSAKSEDKSKTEATPKDKGKLSLTHTKDVEANAIRMWG